MKVIGVTKTDSRDTLGGAILPRERGVLIKAWDPVLGRSVSSYLTSLGSRFITTNPVAIKNEAGAREIRVVPMDWDSPGALSRVAERLTFHPANTEKFIFRDLEVEDKAMAGAQILVDPETRCNLFEVVSKSTPACRCLCGAEYPVDQEECPACLGENPLGRAFAQVGAEIHERIRRIVRTTLDESLVAASKGSSNAASALQSFAARAEKNPRLPEGGDQKAIAHALLKYWAKIFHVRRVTPTDIEGLERTREKKVAAFALSISRSAGTLRAGWSSSCLGGWTPDEGFQTAAMEALGKVWKEAIGDVRDAFLKIFRAAALYRPIEKSYRKVAERTFLGDVWHYVGKPVLTFASALKTFGVSLVLKAGMMLMRSEKERKLHEAFSASVADAVVAAKQTTDSIANSEKAESDLAETLADRAATHLQNLLMEDYAQAPAAQHANIVIGLFAGIGLSTEWILELRPRRTTAASGLARIRRKLQKSRLLRALVLLIATCLIAIAIWLVSP